MRKATSVVAVLLVLVSPLAFTIDVQPAIASEDVWIVAGSMNVDRAYHTATLLSNGKVLVVGGMRAYTYIGTNSCELYNPSTGTWSITTSLSEGRLAHTATLLDNGKVLVTGGVSTSGSEGVLLSSCELYDPITEEWTLTGSLNVPREFHAATLLPNGKVLVVGGNSFGGGFAWGSSCELYDPISGLWVLVNPLNTGREHALGALLANGEVLVAGGGVPGATATCELYNPLTETWRYTASMHEAREWAGGTLLQNGKFLAGGGGDEGGVALTSCELYDSTKELWVYTGALNCATLGHTATLLTSGEVLVAGWGNSELYNPDNGVWTYSGATFYNRLVHTATLLTNGNVIVAGGIVNQATRSCELFMRDHDVAVTSIRTSKTDCLPEETIGQGSDLSISVEMENEGSCKETFNMTAFVNNTAVKSCSVTLYRGETQTVAFSLNTSGWANGYYNISAIIDIVPGETDTANNAFVYGCVFVTIQGDIDGDRDVDIFDIVRMALVYGISKPNPRYDPNSDIDDDSDIDIFDIVLAAANYGKSW